MIHSSFFICFRTCAHARRCLLGVSGAGIGMLTRWGNRLGSALWPVWGKMSAACREMNWKAEERWAVKISSVPLPVLVWFCVWNGGVSKAPYLLDRGNRKVAYTLFVSSLPVPSI